MPVERLLKARVITPRSKLERVVDKLYAFGYFHLREGEGGEKYYVVNELQARARSLSIEIENLTRQLGLTGERGVVETFLRGDRSEPQEFNVEGIKELIERLEAEAMPIIKELKGLLEEEKKLREELDNAMMVAAGLETIVDLKIDLQGLRNLKKFHANLFIAPTKSISELSRSIEKGTLLSKPISKNESVVLLVTLPSERQRVERVVESFGLKQLAIPSGLPRNPSEAYEVVRSKIARLNESIQEVSKKVSELKELYEGRLLAIRDLSRMLRETLDGFKGESLKRVAILEGYVPASMKEKLLEVLGEDAYVEIREVSPTDAHHHERPPTLVRHNKIVRPYMNVTELQGLPGYHEIDPTPLVAIFFTIFYGIMFADLGQGLVILAGGIVLWSRAKGLLRTWGMLLVFLGLSASIVGFLIQEAFGFSLAGMLSFPPVIELIHHANGESSFNVEAIQSMFQFALILGFTHVLIGLILGAISYFRLREYAEGILKTISAVMYVFGLMLGIAFLGAGGFAEIMTSQKPAPLLGIPSGTLGTIAVYTVIACILFLLLGRPLMGYLGIGPKEKLGSALGMGMLEVMENILMFISNTLSYVRLVILLLVHVVLMLLVNSALGMGVAGIPVLIIGNLGVIGLEGLVVFLQALRLHVYEFFTKFYEGSGIPFKPLLLNSKFAKVVIGVNVPRSR